VFAQKGEQQFTYFNTKELPYNLTPASI